MPHDPPRPVVGPVDKQPEAKLHFSEYELQVLETIVTHAIENGAVRADLTEVIASLDRKVKTGRSDLAIARRRLAVELANRRAQQREDSADG